MNKIIETPIILIYSIVCLILFLSFNLSAQSIRLDEAQTIWVATKPVNQMLKFIAQDVHTPLYFLIQHYWTLFLGTNINIVRIPSFIFFILTTIFNYKLFLENSNQRVAILSCILFIISPFITWYSLESRMYTQLTFFTVLSHLFFLRLLRTDTRSGKLGFVLSTVLGLYTHYFFSFLTFTQFLYLVLQKLIINKDFPVFLKAFRLFFLAGILFLPWFIYGRLQGLGTNTSPQVAIPNSFSIFQTLLYFLIGFNPSSFEAILIAFWPILSMVALLIFTLQKKDSGKNINYFLAVTFIPPAIIFLISILIRPILLPRYLIFILPTFFYLLALLIFNFSKRLQLILSTGLILIMLVFSISQVFSNYTPVKEDYRGLVEDLKFEAKPNDIIVLYAPFTIYPVEYYYKGNTKIETIPQWDRFNQGSIPTYSNANLVSQIDDYKTRYSRLFLALSYDQGNLSDIKGYLDQNYELLENKIYSPGLELRVYKLRYDI